MNTDEKYRIRNLPRRQIGQIVLGYLWIILDSMMRHCHRVRWLMSST